MKTRYKYIHFASEGVRFFNGHQMYECRNNRSGAVLANIFYYQPWKQYCFTQVEQNAVFNDTCLADIQHFIGQLKPEQAAPPTGR